MSSYFSQLFTHVYTCIIWATTNGTNGSYYVLKRGRLLLGKLPRDLEVRGQKVFFEDHMINLIFVITIHDNSLENPLAFVWFY